MKCEICNEEFEKYGSLSIHISKKHKITVEEYSIKYLNKQPNNCPVCGKLTTFRSLKCGFKKFCSDECQRNGCQKNKKYYYIIRGYSETEAIKEVANFQSECGKKAQQHLLPKHINTKVEYWINKRLY